MNFSEVEELYAALRQEYKAGRLTAEAFDEQLKAMMVQDSQGRWWAKSREKGEWHTFDLTSNSWLRAEPPETPARPASTQQQQTMTPLSTSPQVGAQPGPTAPKTREPAPGAATSAGAAPQVDSAAPAPGARSSSWTMAPLPELGTGVKLFYYFISFIVPIVGIVLFLVYRNKPAAEDRSAARLCLILGVISLLLLCSCTGIGMIAALGSLSS